MLKPQPLTVTLPSDREIVITRMVNAPRHLVFDCYTKPELVRRWLLGPSGWTMPVCEIDLRVGGRYRYVWQHADGRQMGMGGVFREIDPPHRVIQTELFDQDWTGGETISTLVLTEEQCRTTIANTVLYASKEARDGALKTGMTDGMEAGYVRLDELAAELLAASR
ncbi:MAG: ATPase [Acidobacteria bacterium]|nr:MAG: ATPase [Acidobacteriota bacterium]